jgi:hypothetical protein
MLNKKVKHNRLRPKAPKEPKYLSWLHNQSDIFCFACGKQNKLECHHIKQFSTDVKDDRKIIMLCGEECHRNGAILSAHGTPKMFREAYPIEVQLENAEKLYNQYKKEK